MTTTTLALVFISVSQTFNLPTGLLSALCYVESNHDVRAIHMDDGGSSSIGLCQVKLSTARYLGYRGDAKKLQMDGRVNAHYAGKYLRLQLTKHNGDILKAVAGYNSGTTRLDYYGLPRNHKYVYKVLRAWAAKR